MGVAIWMVAGGLSMTQTILSMVVAVRERIGSVRGCSLVVWTPHLIYDAISCPSCLLLAVPYWLLQSAAICFHFLLLQAFFAVCVIVQWHFIYTGVFLWL